VLDLRGDWRRKQTAHWRCHASASLQMLVDFQLLLHLLDECLGYLHLRRIYMGHGDHTECIDTSENQVILLR